MLLMWKNEKRSLSSNEKFILFMKEKGKENNREEIYFNKTFTISKQYFVSCTLFVIVTFVIKIIPEQTCLVAFPINFNMLILFIFPISPFN